MMKRQIGFFVALAVAAAACADNSSTLTAPEDVAFTRGISGPTWVYGAFTIAGSGAGAGFAPGENAHPQAGTPAGGSCRQADGTISGTEADNTTWFNGQGQGTSAKFCEGTDAPPTALVCTIDAVRATYALGSENENLNFDVDQADGYVAGTNPDLFVHWRIVQHDTRGAGVLAFSYTCDSGQAGDGTLDLTQFAAAENLFQTTLDYDRGLNADGVGVQTDDGLGAMTELAWDYRCRAGAQQSAGCDS